MIVRTYSRRNRNVSSKAPSLHAPENPFSQEISQDAFDIGFLNDGPSSWSFHSDASLNLEEPKPKAKKARNGKKNNKTRIVGVNETASFAQSVTLMETQEFGEMMEHADEVNFALDGLRNSQPVRIRRASLLSLLSICGTIQQRRVLRTQGMAKTIIDSILDLNFNDSTCNLAAAGLFYILTIDNPDDHLLESPSCIEFLLKLLKPIAADSSNDRVPSIASKLLALYKDTDNLQESTTRLDSTSEEIFLKVQDVLVKCKELKSSDNGNCMGRPELNPKWIALLTMEKASLSTISLEETSGIIRKTGGNFKEKLRQFGGLESIFEVALNCHSILEGKLGSISPLNNSIKYEGYVQSLVLLLKFLKIMENATFLSEDNQSYLLGLRGKLDHQGSLSFVELIMSVINILSGFFLNEIFAVTIKGKPCSLSNQIGCTSDMDLVVNHRANDSEIPSKHFSIEKTSQNSQRLGSFSYATDASLADSCLLKMRINSSTMGSCSVTSSSSNRRTQVTKNGLRKNILPDNRSVVSEEIILMEDNEDPFAFDEDDFDPWRKESGKKRHSQTQKRVAVLREPEDVSQSEPIISQQESSNGENYDSRQICSTAVTEEISELLSDCLLTSVKVLMNLTNDNSVGCRQIAAYGGLETMSSLIAVHFPSFRSSSSTTFSETPESYFLSQSTVDHDREKDVHLTEQQLDFLVAILGLLVNLVEKDGHNRSRLAGSSVLLPSSQGLCEEIRSDVIPLLCNIFLANRGAGEATENGNLSLGNQAAVKLGEKEAEKTIIEAYSALLLAFLSTESKSIRNAIADRLPDRKVSILVPVLERFLAFHLTLNMISPETHVAVTEVIESCRVS